MHGRFAVLAATVLLLLAGCDDDPEKPKPTNRNTSPYKDLTQRWHVLHNVQQSYNDMDAERYVAVLDDNFLSIFFPGDGGQVPESWGALEERESAREMLNKGGGRYDNPVLSIDFHLAGITSATWVEVMPDQDIFPGETHFMTTIPYEFTIETTNGTRYATEGTPAAQFTVREQTGGTWRLVRWRDMGPLHAALVPQSLEKITWGVLKATYK